MAFFPRHEAGSPDLDAAGLGALQALFRTLLDVPSSDETRTSGDDAAAAVQPNNQLVQYPRPFDLSPDETRSNAAQLEALMAQFGWPDIRCDFGSLQPPSQDLTTRLGNLGAEGWLRVTRGGRWLRDIIVQIDFEGVVTFLLNESCFIVARNILQNLQNAMMRINFDGLVTLPEESGFTFTMTAVQSGLFDFFRAHATELAVGATAAGVGIFAMAFPDLVRAFFTRLLNRHPDSLPAASRLITMDGNRLIEEASNATGLLELEQGVSNPAAAAAVEEPTADMPMDVDDGSHGAQDPESDNNDHGYYDLRSGRRGRRY